MRVSILIAALMLLAVATAAAACGGSGPTNVSPRTVSTGSVTTPSRAPATSTSSTMPVTSTDVPASLPVTSEVPSTVRAPVTITVLYDNSASLPGTRADWGFSCLVEGLDKTVLFDTGADGGILVSNMEVLEIRPEGLDIVILSHQHGDHIGGLARIVERNPDVSVYFPGTFSERSISAAREAGARLVPFTEPVSICAGLSLTAPSGGPQESALVVSTATGWVLITGCAHPGVLELAGSAAELVDGPIYAVLGGFHLMSHSADQVSEIIHGLRELGVERCGPAHCTGKAATAQMAAAFGDGFIEMGVGATVTF